MDQNNRSDGFLNTIDWKIIAGIVSVFILPVISVFLPIKYGLRTFMAGIIIVAAYVLIKGNMWANKYSKECDNNKENIEENKNEISSNKEMIQNNAKDISTLRESLKTEQTERRHGDELFNSVAQNVLNAAVGVYNQSASSTNL